MSTLICVAVPSDEILLGLLLLASLQSDIRYPGTVSHPASPSSWDTPPRLGPFQLFRSSKPCSGARFTLIARSWQMIFLLRRVTMATASGGQDPEW